MRKITRILLALLLACVVTCGLVFAQTQDQRWAFGLHANTNNYQGDLGNEFLDFSDIDPGIGLSVSYYLSPTFDILAKITYFDVDYEDEDGTYGAGNSGFADYNGGTPYGNWKFNGDMWANTLNLVFKLNNGWLFNEDAAIKPFITGGIGETRIHSEVTRNTTNSKQYHNLNLYYGAGLKFGLSEKLNLVLEAGVHNPMTDVYDGIDQFNAPTWGGVDGGVNASDDEFIQYSLGLTYNIGKKKDADGDGVSDKKDMCPNTPQGIGVDENGCPFDRDKDGVPDHRDACPDVKGTIKGCPDKDGDGIADKNDACPDVAGPKSLKGCPDTDKDGVIDKNDKCPDTPRGAKVDSKGCAVDSDGDGLKDYEDKCPNVAGPKSNNGCPVDKKDQAVVDYSAKNILFNTNSAVIKTESYPIIDNVVNILKANPAYNLSIEGHTDSQGSSAYNQSLSERRAKAVEDYIAGKGIDANRLSSAGYGEDRPVDTNATAEGRQNNRRSELKLSVK